MYLSNQTQNRTLYRNHSEINKDKLICRIYLEEGQINGFIKPCECKGSIQYVHQDFLKTWLLRTHNIDQIATNRVCCELWKKNFICEVLFQQKYEFSQLLRIPINQKYCLIGFFILSLSYSDQEQLLQLQCIQKKILELHALFAWFLAFLLDQQFRFSYQLQYQKLFQLQKFKVGIQMNINVCKIQLNQNWKENQLENLDKHFLGLNFWKKQYLNSLKSQFNQILFKCIQLLSIVFALIQ